MNGILICTSLGAMTIAAAGTLVGPPAATDRDVEVITRQLAITQHGESHSPPVGRWEVNLQPVGSLRIVVNDRTRNVFLNDQLLPANRVVWQPNDLVTILDETQMRQFQVVLEQNGGIRVRPGNWLEYQDSKSAPRVAIGIYTEPLLAPLAAQLKLDPSAALLVTAVVENMPAFKSGVKVFDVITGVDDETLVTRSTLEKVVRVKQPGEEVRLRLVRQAQPLEVSVAVQEVTPIPPEAFDLLNGPAMPDPDLVFDLQSLRDGSPMGLFGPQDGQVIIEFNGDRALFYPTERWNNLRAPAGARSIVATTTISDVEGLEAKIDQLTVRIASLEALLRRHYGDDRRFLIPRP